MLTRKDLENKEKKVLAHYAAKAGETRGRVHKEPEHVYRGVYQRDKDRIIYSTAFRRLEYKTQVFVNHEGDYYRTRLTHTLEVVQVAGTIARALRLNEELVEAIALAHDLGHTPFGHAGESVLAEIMQTRGGFEHNTHGLRVVDILEKKYPDFPGLNLTYEVREGIIKHRTNFDRPDNDHALRFKGMPTLEAQVVDVADEIAYDNHDLDDGITSGLIDEVNLSDVGLWKETKKEIKKKYPAIENELCKFQVIKMLINKQVTDVIGNTESLLKKYKVRTSDDVKKCGRKLVVFSPGMTAARKPMREFLMRRLYKHYRVVRMSEKAERFLKELFRAYLDKPEQLPTATFSRIKTDDKYRVICDYIAGMTDRYALEEYKKFFDPFERV